MANKAINKVKDGAKLITIEANKVSKVNSRKQDNKDSKDSRVRASKVNNPISSKRRTLRVRDKVKARVSNKRRVKVKGKDKAKMEARVKASPATAETPPAAGAKATTTPYTPLPAASTQPVHP